MANATITVLEADGVTQTDVIVLDVGRQAAAASKSVAASTEDKAVLDAIAASLATLDNVVAGNEAQVDVLTLPALPAGTNNIGDVDVLTLPALPAGNNNIGDVDIASIAAGDNNIGNVDVVTLPSIPAGNNNIGDVDILGLAVAHGSNPTAVAAGAAANFHTNRAGVQFTIGGHPNIVSIETTIADADGAQTNAALVTVAGGTKIVVTAATAITSESNTGSVAYRLGFGAATLGAASATATSGIILSGKLGAGKGHQRGNGLGIIAIGGDGEDLRLTCDDPAGGDIRFLVSYFTIES